MPDTLKHQILRSKMQVNDGYVILLGPACTKKRSELALVPVRIVFKLFFSSDTRTSELALAQRTNQLWTFAPACSFLLSCSVLVAFQSAREPEGAFSLPDRPSELI